MKLRKIIFLCCLFVASLNAKVIKQYPSLELINSNIPIVDIRRPEEWRETGILKGAITIMFFNKDGEFNTEKFLKELNSKVDTKKIFAIICRTANRTGDVSKFLSKEYGYKVIDLQGGMVYAKSKNLPIVEYK